MPQVSVKAELVTGSPADRVRPVRPIDLWVERDDEFEENAPPMLALHFAPGDDAKGEEYSIYLSIFNAGALVGALELLARGSSLD